MIRPKSFISRFICFLLFPVLLSCTGQHDSQKTGASIQSEAGQDIDDLSLITFSKLSHDFGTIIEGEKVVCYFNYENTGRADLVISAVEATCGCTTPDWSSEPLKSGDRKSLQIIFDTTGRSGTQRKVVTVMSNASNSLIKLTIKANIET